MVDRAVVDTVRIPWVRYSPAWPYLYWGLTFLGAVYCAAAISGLVGIGGCAGEIVACDAAAYYYAEGYTPVEGTPQFGYSPAFSALFAPFRLLGFDAFLVVWFGLHVGVLLWLRAGWLLAVPGVNEDVIRGNVTVFIALAVVVGMRHGSAWAFPLLTKVLPGVGIVWHLARREWSLFAEGVVLTAFIVAIGLVFNPQLWIEWGELLQAHSSGSTGTLLLRLVLAGGIIAFAGLTSRAWLVPVGMLMTWSFITPPVFMVLAAIPRLKCLSPSAGIGSAKQRQVFLGS
jgi:hypothetical protein